MSCYCDLSEADCHMAGHAGDEAQIKERIRRCNHDNIEGLAMGYAYCKDCGALLPDEDPDLKRKLGRL